MNKGICIYLVLLSNVLKKSLFSQFFDFILFLLMKLTKLFKSSKCIKQYIVEEIISNDNFDVIETIYLEFHLKLNHILNNNNRKLKAKPFFKISNKCITSFNLKNINNKNSQKILCKKINFIFQIKFY